MSFTAKILSVYYEAKVKTEPADHVYRFGKKKILLSKEQQEKWGTVYLGPFESHKIEHGLLYTIDKIEDNDGKKWFQIRFGDDYKHYLEIDHWNRFKLNWIHKRYWVQKNWEWFLKTLVAALIGALVALIGTDLGYRRGYQNGLKEGLFLHPDTAQQSPPKTLPATH